MSMRSLATTAVLLSGSLTVAVGATPPAGAATGPTRTTAQIAARARQSVVTIETTNAAGGEVALGSGFVVDSRGIVVTNWHVMVGAAEATVTFTNGQVFHRVAFLDGDPTVDIAILKIPASNLPALTMTAETPPVGSRVVAVGSPLGLSDTVSEGIVSAVRLVRGRVLVQTTTPIGPGSSGGPLLNERGTVFAVSTLMLDGAPLMNFGVPAKVALGFVRDGLAERALPEVFRPAPVARATTPAAADAAPGRATKPRTDLSGTYVVSSATDGTSETRRQLLVAGREVGLLRLDHDVVPVNVLRTNESGEVALAVGDQAYSGYQTEQGFVYFAGGTGDAITAERWSQPLASNIGVYVATSRQPAGSGRSRRVVDWAGEAAVVVDKSRVAISLRLSNAEGGALAFTASGTADDLGRFTMAAPGGSFGGTMTAGVIQAEWCPRGSEGLAACVPIQARRR